MDVKAPAPLPKVFASFSEVAAAYALSPSTVTRYVAAGRFRAIKAGGRVLLDLKSVDEFFAGCPEVKPRGERKDA